MKTSLSFNRKRTLIYAALFLGIVAVYLSKATASGLWFDEAIEYFYSSTLRGPVPGARSDKTIYQRILLTYQPPLYNVLMYGWLSVYDSEFWFRLAGILVTFFGGAGIYLALKEITDENWAAAGAAVYLLAGGVSAYALEAGEYHLMMSMVCWTICFYLRAVRREKGGDIAGFIAFACLSVYSQYGAVFLIVPMYVSLLIQFIKQKKKIGLLFVFSLLAAAAAGLLVVFFLLPQMQHQGSMTVSHKPVFAFGVIDVFVGLAKTAAFTFSGGKWIQPAVLLPAGAFLILALLKKDKIFFRLLALFFCSWIAYYALTACSVYGYNGYNSSIMGTANIGGRYSLMFSPLLTVTLVYGVYCACARKTEKPARLDTKKLTAAALCLLTVYSAVGVWSILSTKSKEDVREATQVWYAEEAYNSRTLVNQWDDPIFQFYLTHHADYQEDYQANIYLASWWEKTNAAQMEKKLKNTGLLEADDFYYITLAAGSFEDHCHVLTELLEEHGFTVEELYRNATALFHAVRK